MICSRCKKEITLTEQHISWQSKIMLLKDHYCLDCQRNITLELREASNITEQQRRHYKKVMEQRNHTTTQKRVQHILNLIK